MRGRPGWSRRRAPAGRAWWGDGQAGPLALGLRAQVGAHLLKGHLQLPAQDKPFQYLGRVRCRISTEQGLVSMVYDSVSS